ncbi:MAG: hypothetical protein HYR76_04225 [Ignavibacteria bacterium]|nr:hypothetical protein [Ignavibacteria bacterium]
MKLEHVVFIFIVNGVMLVTVHAQDTSGVIQLASGQRLTGKVEYKQPFLAKPYVLLNDSIKYKIEEIRAFQCANGYFAKLPKSSKVVRRTLQGKIDLYQDVQSYFIPGQSYTVNTPGGSFVQSTPASFNTYTLDYFSKNGGDILDASLGNLKTALVDNPESMKYLSEYQTLNLVQWGLVGTGLGMVITSFLTATKEDGPNKGLLIGGGVTAVLGWIPKLMKDGKMEDAVRVYNQN